MIKNLKSKLKNKKGFTLVEMIVVIAIIAILIALLAPNVARMIENAQRTSDAAKAKTIMSTAQAYATEAITSNNAINGGALTPIAAGGKNYYIVHLDGTPVSPATRIDEHIMRYYYGSIAATVPEYISNSGNGFLPGNTLSATADAYLIVSSDGAVMGCIYTQTENVGSSGTSAIVKGVAGESPFQSGITAFTDASIRGRVFTLADGKIQ